MNHKRLVETLILHEKMVLELYDCPAGKKTIGVGHNIEDIGISKETALFILDEDIKKTISELEKYEWFAGLSEVRQEVLINLHFNIGGPTFRKFKKMIANLEKGNFHGAADEMIDSKWYKQVGTRADYLISAMYNNEFPG